MNLVEVLLTAAIGGGAALAVALGFASLRGVSLSTRREILLTALAVAAAAPLVAFLATALGLGLRPSLAPTGPTAPLAAPLAETVPIVIPNVDSAWSDQDGESRFADLVTNVHPAAVASPAASIVSIASAAAPPPWARIAVLAWLVGAALGLLRIAASLLRLRALRRSLSPCLDVRAPGAFTSDALRVPATVGILDPVVVLPVDFSSYVDDAELAAILRHERAHVTRRDPFCGLVARLARAIHWANPLAHFAARRFDTICESLADGAAVSDHSSLAPRYASCLVRLAERAVDPLAAAGIHGIVGGRGVLTRRVEALLDPARHPDPRSSAFGRAAAIALGLTATVGLVCCCRGARTCPPACCNGPEIVTALPAAPDPGEFQELTEYAGRRNRGADRSAAGVHYYKELEFGPGLANRLVPLVRRFSPAARLGTRPVLTDGMLTTGVDPAYAGKIVVFFEPGTRIDPESLRGDGGSFALQVLQQIPGTGNVPVAPAPNGIEVQGDRILFTPARLPLPDGQYSVAVYPRQKNEPFAKATDPTETILHSFTVGSSDTVAPILIYTIPTNRALGGPPILFTFSEAIDPDSVTPETVLVFESTAGAAPVPPAPGFPRVVNMRAGEPPFTRGYQVVWQPATSLKAGQSYRVAIGGHTEQPGSKTISDLAGNHLASVYMFEITVPGDSEASPFQEDAAKFAKAFSDAGWVAAPGIGVRLKVPPLAVQPLAIPMGSAARAKAWSADLHSMKDPATRAATLALVRFALGSNDPSEILAALRTACGMGDLEYDRDEFRARILPHATHPDNDEIRRWARRALVAVKPDPADLPLLIEDAQTAGPYDAELNARDLTTLSQGKIEGATANAVLYLLRDGTDFRKAVVMRGLQSAKSFSPGVEARLIAIVRSVDPQDFDSHYFFEFLASRWDPKSDAVVDVIVDTTEMGGDQIEVMLRGLETGLSNSQRERAASRLLTMVDSAVASYARRFLLTTLAKIAGAAHVARLEAIAANENADATTRKLATSAADSARARR